MPYNLLRIAQEKNLTMHMSRGTHTSLEPKFLIKPRIFFSSLFSLSSLRLVTFLLEGVIVGFRNFAWGFKNKIWGGDKKGDPPCPGWGGGGVIF
jgi:hypothetical protein